MRTTAVLLRGGRWREGTRATVVQMLCTYLLLTIAVASSHGQTAQPQAEPNTALQVSMVGGYSGVTGVPTGQQVLLQARGTQIRADAEREEGSFTSVSWSASAGSFPYGSEGQEVIWQAPDYVCRTTIRAETGGLAGPATAEAIVPSTTVATMTVDTLYLMAIHMVMVNPVLTAYPYIGDAFHTRVLLCVCAPDEGGVYCGRWWPTLSWAFENGRVQGALAEPAGKPGTNTPPPLNDYVWGPIYPWPTYWAQPTIYWQIGFERGSDSDANYNRDYWFDLLGSPWYTPVGGDQWGEDYRTYSVMGQHRLRVYVVWGAVGWSSNDWEHATRIFVRNRSVYVPPMPPLSNDAQRRSYSEWLSSYYDEPYEWGGEWVGGKETPGTARAGGPATYDGYGIDCSGLVCNAAYRAAYNWNAGWRTDTTGLASSYYTSATATPTAGDLLVKPTHHVISIVGQSGDSINIIHAKGGSSGDPQPKNKVAYETGKSRQYYLDRDYQGRTMLQHWGRVI